MVGHATHGDTLPLPRFTGCERDVQRLRGDLRVRAEQLVEIPKTKEDKAVRILPFDPIVLHQHGCLFAHRRRPPT